MPVSSETESTPSVWKVSKDDEVHADDEHEFEYIGSSGQTEFHECTICGEVVVVQHSLW